MFAQELYGISVHPHRIACIQVRRYPPKLGGRRAAAWHSRGLVEQIEALHARPQRGKRGRKPAPGRRLGSLSRFHQADRHACLHDPPVCINRAMYRIAPEQFRRLCDSDVVAWFLTFSRSKSRSVLGSGNHASAPSGTTKKPALPQASCGRSNLRRARTSGAVCDLGPFRRRRPPYRCSSIGGPTSHLHLDVFQRRQRPAQVRSCVDRHAVCRRQVYLSGAPET